MELLNNYRQFIFILIITVVLGYFLGIAVSTVVDYRLKDAVINFPKQKSKVIVRLEKDKILKPEKNSKKNKNSKKSKLNKKRFPDMKRINIETFVSSKDNTKNNTQDNTIPNNLKKTWQYNVDNYDPNLEAYAKLNRDAETKTSKDFNKANYENKNIRENKGGNINNLNAYNEENANELYQEIQKTGEYSGNNIEVKGGKLNKTQQSKKIITKKLKQIKADLIVLENKVNK